MDAVILAEKIAKIIRAEVETCGSVGEALERIDDIIEKLEERVLSEIYNELYRRSL